MELTLKGDERANGLVVLSGMAVLDCTLFEYENQVGTEYLFGVVRCAAQTQMLGRGKAVISDEHEGLNFKDPFVAAVAQAVSARIGGAVQAGGKKLTHLERATTSGRTAEMIERLLQHMSEAVVVELGIESSPEAADRTPAEEEPLDALRFTTPFYYRKPGHPFHVAPLVDAGQLPDGEQLTFELDLPESMRMEPAPVAVPVDSLRGTRRIEWTVTGEVPGGAGRDHGPGRRLLGLVRDDSGRAGLASQRRPAPSCCCCPTCRSLRRPSH